MKKAFFYFLILILFSTACDQTGRAINKSDPMEAGRGFIEASLIGNYDDAKKYILPDSMNLMYFDRAVEFYHNMNASEKQGYKDANIIINPTENLGDSVVIINYSNTFKHKPAKIKMIRVNKEWLVDFKYSFAGNT